MSATLAPAIIGEWLRHRVAANAATLSAALTDFNQSAAGIPLPALYGRVQVQALAISMKEIYGWLLIASILCLLVIVVSYGPVRPGAIFPKWRTIRKIFRRSLKEAPPQHC